MEEAAVITGGANVRFTEFTVVWELLQEHVEHITPKQRLTKKYILCCTIFNLLRCS
jgi:hypothetical protein